MSRSAERAHAARRTVIEAALAARTAHIGSSLSIVDVLAVLYSDVLTGDDRFLLSKGHAASALYATLAEHGELDRDEVISGYCADGGEFAGHPERGVAGIEMTGGSLGHGPAIAVGTALADRHDGAGRTYCLVGDGELNEGSVWEAIALAGHHGLANLTVIVDANGLQGLGRTGEVLDLEPLMPKLTSFGWHVSEVDGHDHDALRRVLPYQPSLKPHAVIARTTKGFGVSFMENELMWHYKSLRPEQRDEVLADLEATA